MILDGERCRVNFTDSAIAPLVIRVKQAGMDYIAGISTDFY